MTTYRVDGSGEFLEPVTVLDDSKRLVKVRGEDGQVFSLSRRRIRREDGGRISVLACRHNVPNFGPDCPTCDA